MKIRLGKMITHTVLIFLILQIKTGNAPEYSGWKYNIFESVCVKVW